MVRGEELDEQVSEQGEARRKEGLCEERGGEQGQEVWKEENR